MNFLRSLKPLKGDGTLGSDGTSNLTNIVDTINTVISAGLGILTAGVIILAVAIAFKFFTADDDTKRKNAKQQLIYAIIGVVVLIALLILEPIVTSAVKNALSDDSKSMFHLFF